jgi:hypothetical protein
MNDLSANDILLFGALVGALALVLIGGLWALAHRGRKRWRAARVQIIVAQPGDAVVITYSGSLTAKQREQIIASAERRLPIGVSAMVMDGGLQVARVVSVKDGINPIPQPAPGP